MAGSQRNFRGTSTTVALLAALLSTLSSCSRPAEPQVQTKSFHWTRAKERYVAGDYQKAISHLEHLIDGPNEFAGRALPFSLVLTSGLGAGYMELADYYAAGAKTNKARALDFQRKASDYRAMANHMVLQFAENTKKMDLLTGDSIQLAFGPPKGGAVEPALFTQIAHGMMLSHDDEEAALSIAMDRGVLLAVCNIAGAPNNLAKASQILQRGEFLVRRPLFMKAVSDQLERESELYARNKLDDSAKLAMLRQLAQEALKDDRGRTAMVLPANSN